MGLPERFIPSNDPPSATLCVWPNTADWRCDGTISHKLSDIVTDDACILTVAAVMGILPISLALTQGGLFARTPHIVQVDGTLALPEIGHGACFGHPS